MKYATDKIKKNTAMREYENIMAMADTNDMDVIDHDDYYFHDMLKITDDYREYGDNFALCLA